MKIASCQSPLALLQVKEVMQQLPGVDYAVIALQSCGDMHNYNAAIFSKELYNTLLQGIADIAIHPAEHVPCPMPEGLEVICLINAIDINHDTESQNTHDHPLQGYLVAVARERSIRLQQLFALPDIRQKWGTVSICGFGPGNPELLTFMADKALKTADAIFFDDLIDADFLQNYNAEKVYVGKRKDNHAYKQADINEMLYKSAISGKETVRLKGGDPFIYGRGGEELDYLGQRLVKCKIIPGITAAMAAAAFAEIPLTYRGISGSVAFCTGYPENKIQVPNADTLVYYMGASNIATLAQKLTESGLSPNLPMALVHNASDNNQQTWHVTLGTLLNSTQTYPSPLITIVGNVAQNRNAHNWYSNRLRILVTGTEVPQNLKHHNITHLPLICMSAIIDYSEAIEAIKKIKQFQWVLFTSKYAVDFFFNILFAACYDSRWLSNIKIGSIGKTTSAHLLKHGIVPDIQAVEESSEGILKLFHFKTSTKILIPRSDIALDILPSGLTQQGHTVTTLVVYNNTMPVINNKPNLSGFDVVVFSSPSCVKNFKQLYPEVPENLYFLPRGKVTRQAVVDEFGEVEILDRLS